MDTVQTVRLSPTENVLLLRSPFATPNRNHRKTLLNAANAKWKGLSNGHVTDPHDMHIVHTNRERSTFTIKIIVPRLSQWYTFIAIIGPTSESLNSAFPPWHRSWLDFQWSNRSQHPLPLYERGAYVAKPRWSISKRKRCADAVKGVKTRGRT